MIVHDSWWSNGSARLTIIDYHKPFDQGFSLLRSCSGRSHVTLPVPTRLLQHDIHSFLGVCAFVCSDQWASRLVLIVYAAPIIGAIIRKKMKAIHWLVYFRERNVYRFEAAAWGRGALRDSGPSGCEGDYPCLNMEFSFPSNPGGEDSHMKQTGMLVVSLRGVNFGFWSRLGCSGRIANILCRRVSFRVPWKNTELREEKQKSNFF